MLPKLINIEKYKIKLAGWLMPQLFIVFCIDISNISLFTA